MYKGTFGGRPAIYKQRFAKSYRHPVLDNRLNTQRMLRVLPGDAHASAAQEARCIVKAWRGGVPTPTVYHVDPTKGLLVMEFVEGCTAKEALLAQKVSVGEAAHRGRSDFAEALGEMIGELVARLHAHGVIHGDLTTSNIIVAREAGGLVLIDFGLSGVSSSVEDRAVDLYVLERAILSTHPEHGALLFALIVNAYGRALPSSKATLSKLAEVQLRGRKRDMSG